VGSVREKVTSAIAWTLVPRVVQMVGSVYTSILIVRSLGQFDYGTLSVIRSILFAVVVFAGLGLGPALNRFIPELRATDQSRVGRRLLFRSLYIQGAVWALVTVVLLCLRPLLRHHFPTYADPLILGVGVSMAEVAAGTVGQYAVASYRTRQMAAASAAGTLVLAGSTVLLLRLGLRVPGVLLASAIGWTACTLTVGAFLRPRGGGEAPEGARPEAAAAFSWRRLLSYALPWVPNHMLTYVVWRQSETVLLGLLRTRVEAGFFDLAYKLPQLVLEFVPGSIYPLVLAGFAETATVAKEKMKDVITAYYWILFFLVAPLCLLGLAMGNVILTRMYGPAMAQAGPYCQAFFVIFTLSFFGTPLSMTVYVIEKVWVNLLLNIVYAVVTVGLDLLLIPRYGLLGATIPTGLVTALTPVVRYYIARRYLPDLRIPWGFIGRCFLASTPLLSLFWIKQAVTSLTSLSLVLLLAAAVTLVSYRIFRVLGPAQREMIRRSKIPGRDTILRLL
jgi:O-antigen/teichoic acid export membrane protein